MTNAAALAFPPARATAEVTTRRTAGELARAMEVLFRRLRIAVIHAGDKGREGAVLHAAANHRSWKSYEPVARDIAAALARLGIREEVAVLADDLGLPGSLAAGRTHMAWLNTAGVQGRAAMAHAPGMLELCGLPYVGHDPLVAALLDDKHRFKRQLVAAGIPTAPSLLVRPGPDALRPMADRAFARRFAQTFGRHRGPFVIKPVSGRASLNVTYVETVLQLRDAVAAVHEATHGGVLIEPYLGGPEYCVAVAGRVVASGGRLSRRDNPFVFSALERVLEPGETIFTSMDLRPITGERARLLCPDRDREVLRDLDSIARAVADEFALETLVRLDLRSDAEGRLFVLEANPKPDLKAPSPGVTSLVSLGLAQHGMTYDDLILSLLAGRVDQLLDDRHPVIGRLAGLA